MPGFYEVGLNKKEIQLNFCKIFSFMTFHFGLTNPNFDYSY